MRAEDLLISVAGHTCLDVIPTLGVRAASFGELLRPGTLVNVGEALTATGGCVANTGVALARLGVRVELMAKIGDDMFGHALLDVLRPLVPESLGAMRIVADEPTSYTIVLSPPGIDRVFLHCSGTNHTFDARDVDDERVARSHILHFGYPPLMRRIYESPAELAGIFARARRAGVTTSLDMSQPDAASEAARIAWPEWLARVLPEVDVFAPSLDEMRLMLVPRSAPAGPVNTEELRAISDRLLGWGARIVALKLGDYGLYLRTTRDADALGAMGRAGPADPLAWRGRELCVPCFAAHVVGTTGSGDSTIAGLLTALGLGLSPEAALTAAVGVGACSVEASDANSAVPHWEMVRGRIDAGWRRLDRRVGGMTYDSSGALAVGSADSVHGGATC